METKPFDAADYLKDAESIAYFVEDSLDANDPSDLARSLRTVVRALGGIEKVSVDSGIPVDILETSLEGVSTGALESVFIVFRALHLKLVAVPAEGKRKAAELAADSPVAA